MGFGNIGIFQLLIVLLIVVLVFGTKKLRSLGGDLGSAIREFRSGVSGDDEADDKPEENADNDDSSTASSDTKTTSRAGTGD